jgi:probable F420-dependent oxidoreductase
MKFGVSMFTTDQSAGPAEVARAVEERGFESFWVSEHSHIPVHEAPPFPGFEPRMYAAMLDPFVSLAAAATVTQRIRLGTAISLVIQRDPINCAKAVASVDHLSNGRMLFGIGAGWNEGEMRNHGTDPSTRFRLMRERVRAMQALWTQEQAEFHGKAHDFDSVWQWPKPVQKPHPPVLVAGSGPGVLRRVVAYGDGWMPVVVPEVADEMRGRVTSMAEFVELVPRLRNMATDAGRPPPSISVSGALLDQQNYDAFAQLEVERLQLRLTPAPLPDVLRELDAHREAVLAVGASLDA